MSTDVLTLLMKIIEVRNFLSNVGDACMLKVDGSEQSVCVHLQPA